MALEPDAEGWHAHCPTLDKYGAATWGETKDKALHNIQEVIEMIVRNSWRKERRSLRSPEER